MRYSIVLLCASAVAVCNCLPMSQEKMLSEIAQKVGFSPLINKMSDHIGQEIEERRKEGTLLDEYDPLAIMVNSVRQLRSEIEQRTGIDLSQLEESKRPKVRPGMPEGMKDVDYTGFDRDELSNLALSVPILLTEPETLKSLKERTSEHPSFQDYIDLAEEQNPDIRRKSVSEVRQRTIDFMRNILKEEMKKLAFVFLAAWAERSQLGIAQGDGFSMFVNKIQGKILEWLLNFVIDKVSDNWGDMVYGVQEFKRSLSMNRPFVHMTGSNRFNHKRKRTDEQSDNNEDDRFQWMLYNMID